MGELIQAKHVAGNSAPQKADHPILRKIQAGQLRVSQPGDKEEKEADRMASRIMRMPDPQGITKNANLLHSGSVQRCINSTSRFVFSSGEPLPKDMREFFEPRFGCNLDAIRIHRGTQDAHLADEINARACTIGSDIVFGKVEGRSGGEIDRRLLAHEITHALQQASVSEGNKHNGDYYDLPRISPVISPLVQLDRKSERNTANPSALKFSSSELRRISENLDLESLLDRRAGDLDSEVGGQIDRWARKHDHEPNYSGLVATLISSPFAILGAVYAPLAIPAAVATTAISTLTNVPDSADVVGEFIARMSLVFDRVRKHIQKNKSNIVVDFLGDHLDVSLVLQGFYRRPHFIRNSLMDEVFGNVFTPADGEDQEPVIDEEKVHDRVFSFLNSVWGALPQLERIGATEIQGPGGGPGPRLKYYVGAVWVDLLPLLPHEALVLVRKLAWSSNLQFVEFIDPAVKEEALSRAENQSHELPNISRSVPRSNVQFMPSSIPERSVLR
jgi:hypothetical protein